MAPLESRLNGDACQVGLLWRKVQVCLLFPEAGEPPAPLGEASEKRSLASGRELRADLADRLSSEGRESAAERRPLVIKDSNRSCVDSQEVPKAGRLVRPAGIVPHGLATFGRSNGAVA